MRDTTRGAVACLESSNDLEDQSRTEGDRRADKEDADGKQENGEQQQKGISDPSAKGADERRSVETASGLSDRCRHRLWACQGHRFVRDRAEKLRQSPARS